MEILAPAVAIYLITCLIVAGLLWKFGAPIRDFIERWLGPLFILVVLLLIGGFYALRFL